MPYKYALRVKERVRETRRYDEDEFEFKYQLTPKELVEGQDNGYKRLVSVTGHPLSAWTQVTRRPTDLKKVIKASQFPAITDYMGTLLAVGDFVVARHKRMDDLQIGRIIGFVKQGKARILPVGYFEQDHGILKFPTEMVQVPPAILGDDPEAEWILAPEELGMLED